MKRGSLHEKSVHTVFTRHSDGELQTRRSSSLQAELQVFAAAASASLAGWEVYDYFDGSDVLAAEAFRNASARGASLHGGLMSLSV